MPGDVEEGSIQQRHRSDDIGKNDQKDSMNDVPATEMRVVWTDWK